MVGLALAVLVPLAVPGMTAGLMTTLNSGAGSGIGPGFGGSPGRVDLFAALSGQLNQSQVTDLVTVTTTEEEPFYLRFGVADDLRTDGFRVRGPNGRRVNGDLPDPSGRSVPGVQRTRQRATVQVSRELNMPLLPVYAEPVSFAELGNSWFYDPNLQVVFSNRENSRGKEYSFDYVRSSYSPQALRRAQPLPADLPLRRQQTVTPDVPEVRTLVEDLTRGASTEYDKVRAIYDYFSEDNGFSYRLSTEQGTSGQAILDFLQNKVGYCQQYAAALAWMVRDAGIPARVAFGFTNGSRRSDDTLTLTNRNLHAWTEVYFDQIGWVPFDATPAYGVPGSTRSAWAPDVDAPEESTPQGGTSDTPDETDPSATRSRDRTSSRRRGPGRGARLRRRRGRPATGGTDGRRVGRGPVRDRSTGHGGRHRSGPGAGRRARRLGRTDRHACRLPDRGGPDGNPTRHGGAAGPGAAGHAGRRRVGGTPARAGGGALAGQADRRTRLVATVLPPSVLSRWRTAVADNSSRLVNSAGQVRRRLLRFSPRRLIASRAGR